jgi:uncharacterized protein (DUF433 family)
MMSPITISKEIQSGEPVFTGTRVPVKNLFDYLKGGNNVEAFLEDFPSVSYEQALNIIELAEGQLLQHSSDKNIVALLPVA